MQQPEREAICQIPPKRMEALLNALIDHMVNDAGGHVRDVIRALLSLGFAAEELTGTFNFQPSDVADCQEEGVLE